MQSPSLTKAKEKGFGVGLFSAQDTVQGECWQKTSGESIFSPGFSLQVRFGLVLPSLTPRPHSPHKKKTQNNPAAFSTNAPKICAVGRDHIHPISSAFSELRWKKREFCHAVWDGKGVLQESERWRPGIPAKIPKPTP